MGRFYISVQPGHEEALYKEIKNFWPRMIDLDGQPTKHLIPEAQLSPGGVLIETADHLGYQVNFFSKLAGRVLLRLASFESRYFDQFEKNLEKIDFSKALDLEFLNNKLNVKVESHKSRLNNEKNILEAVQNVFSKKNLKISDEAGQTLYIRIDKDKVMLSLDTTGEHLHRRGYSTYRGEAPLRETLAAYMIFRLFEFTGHATPMVVADPFAGSGTLLFEAMSADRPNLERDYSWLHFKMAPKLFKSPTWKKNYRGYPAEPHISGLAFDKDEKSILNIQKNEEDFKKIFHFEHVDLKVRHTDSDSINISEYKAAGKKIWLVANPPYGMRLSDEGAKNILEKLAENADGLIVIHPDKWKFKFKNLSMKLTEPFNNQGLKLTLSLFGK